jgi:predicted kinase
MVARANAVPDLLRLLDAARSELAGVREAGKAGPYTGEFGAVHHEKFSGFLFTTGPHVVAEDVAEALNMREAIRHLAAALAKDAPT